MDWPKKAPVFSVLLPSLVIVCCGHWKCSWHSLHPWRSCAGLRSFPRLRLLLYRRCQPWRAKRRLVVPSSSEAALLLPVVRIAPEGKQSRHPNVASSHWEASTEQQRACEVVAQCFVTRTAGAQIGWQRPSQFWGLGCPKIYHEVEDTLGFFTCIAKRAGVYNALLPGSSTRP